MLDRPRSVLVLRLVEPPSVSWPFDHLDGYLLLECPSLGRGKLEGSIVLASTGAAGPCKKAGIGIAGVEAELPPPAGISAMSQVEGAVQPGSCASLLVLPLPISGSVKRRCHTGVVLLDKPDRMPTGLKKASLK